MKLSVRALLVCAACAVVAPAALAQNKNWGITDIKVREYNQGTGELAELNVGETQSSSANAPFGPVLVVVEVTGELEAGHGKSVALTATQGRRTVFTGTYGPGPYQGVSEDGKKFYAPFWVASNVLCDPLKITARVTGQRQAAAVTKTVNFQCGE